MQSPIFFWIAWGIISFWAIKTFYFSFAKEKVERLRKAAFGISLSVLVLSFLPWLSLELGGTTGVTLALEGNVLTLVFLFLLVGSGVLFLTKNVAFLKIGSAGTIINTFLLFILMYQLRPDTFVLSLYDIAPIITFLLLLVCDVVVLLLWQQLQLKEKKKGSVKFDKRLLIGIVLILLFMSGWVLAAKNKTSHPQNPQYTREIISTKFTSEKFGYMISYPTDWTIDTSHSKAPADLITNSTGDALVAIQTIEDGRLLKESGDTKVVDDIKQGFVGNPNYTLDAAFKQTFFDGMLAYVAKGSFKDSKGEWHFVEYTILAGGERLYIVRANTKKNAPTSVKAAENVVTSFSLVPYHKVALLLEVEAFESAVIKNGRSKFGIWIDKWPSTNNPYYTVQVFETFPDHRTTFNWYRVSQKDGKVYRQNIAKDTWEEVGR